MEQLKDLDCVTPKGDQPRLSNADIEAYRQQIPEWEIVEVNGVKRLQRAYKFKNFERALAFTNQVGDLAEEQDHHPLLQTEWGKVTVNWWTHKVNGLHRNDFIMAAKSDEVYQTF